jgi:hypothetical protein
MRERQRQIEKQDLGPGSHIGNDVTIGQDSTNFLQFSPSKKYTPKIELSPSPADYDTKRGEKLVKPKVLDVKIMEPSKKRHSSRLEFKKE